MGSVDSNVLNFEIGWINKNKICELLFTVREEL